MNIDRAMERAQRQYDNMTPPEYDDFECPECGKAIMEEVFISYLSEPDWECPGCGYYQEAYEDYMELSADDVLTMDEASIKFGGRL